MILKTALRRLYVRAWRQQALDSRPKCCIVLHALIKYGIAVRLRVMARYDLNVSLAHSRIFTASALAMSIGRCTSPVDKHAQNQECNKTLHTRSPLDLVSDTKSDSKKQCVQVVASASGITSLKVYL